ncbi:molybdopterin binding domain protein [Syntrophobotulus glycolicus DSM 8271]|uniref:Molybdopterin molybdenumtransferase n=1 Tax=Syntrophobotulus glycolicus (strain DSM 8271 / FlGlyR) TaxID=645991 RepID=F0T0H5_SYNGF|nr:molybdopterin-binding protein [Syntrophobotulus glycolicus]ADY57347.1 molybdopterin binding domain protein [Syntrophobotulus glycolicus DSM 8271]
MKKVRVEDAVGMELCHDITRIVPGQFKGVLYPRGHRIRNEDIAELRKAGKEHIFVWEENAGEIHEDEAAVRIARAIMGPNTEFEQPREGKTMLKSMAKGLLRIDRSLLKRINSMENITIAARPDYFIVKQGDKLAGARIIPLVIKEKSILALEELCRTEGPVFEVKPYRQLKAGLVITGNEVYEGLIEDKFGPLLEEKLADYEADLIGKAYCPDDTGLISRSIKELLKAGADLIILTGGMSVDPDDLTPVAIRDSGAEVVTYGTPVQPGNMFMLAYLGNTALAGVPGGAIFSRTSLLDIVLPRIFSGEKMTREDFVIMGEGGLCNGCASCSYPNCYFGRGR